MKSLGKEGVGVKGCSGREWFGIPGGLVMSGIVSAGRPPLLVSPNPCWGNGTGGGYKPLLIGFQDMHGRQLPSDLACHPKKSGVPGRIQVGQKDLEAGGNRWVTQLRLMMPHSPAWCTRSGCVARRDPGDHAAGEARVPVGTGNFKQELVSAGWRIRAVQLWTVPEGLPGCRHACSRPAHRRFFFVLSRRYRHFGAARGDRVGHGNFIARAVDLSARCAANSTPGPR